MLYISNLPGSVLAGYTLLSTPQAMGFAALLIWVHEQTHLAVFRKYGVPVFGVSLPPFGGLMVTGYPLGSAESVEVAMAGPMSGLVGLVFVIVGVSSHQTLYTFLGLVWAGINLINLLPLYPLDGGWVLKELLTAWVTSKVASRIAWLVTLGGLGLLYVVFPDPKVWVLQIILAGMLLLADFLASRVFMWFSGKHFGGKQAPVCGVAGSQVLTIAGNYFAMVTILALTVWVAVKYLPV